MIEDGLYTRFPKPDYALAFHVGRRPRPARSWCRDHRMSSADCVDIVVHGVGTHGAHPHRGIDPVLVASQIVVSLQSLVSRDQPARARGDHRRLDPRRHEAQHHPRSRRPAAHRALRQLRARATLLDGIDRIARGVARALGVPEDRLPEVTRRRPRRRRRRSTTSRPPRRIQSAFAITRRRDAAAEQPRRHGRRRFRLLSRPSAASRPCFSSSAARRTELATAPRIIRRCSGSRREPRSRRDRGDGGRALTLLRANRRRMRRAPGVSASVCHPHGDFSLFFACSRQLRRMPSRGRAQPTANRFAGIWQVHNRAPTASSTTRQITSCLGPEHR